jgi:hypothetical protein
MRHLLHLAAAFVLVLLAARSSSAADNNVAFTPPTPIHVVFETVDAVTTQSDESLLIEGIVQGESEPRAVSFRVGPTSSQNYPSTGAQATDCHRQAMLALTKPGRFLLKLDDNYPSSYSIFTCTIRRQ